MTYLTIETLHLLAVIAFIGTLFFQVLIRAPASRRLAPAVREAIGPVLGQQASHGIHFVALVLYGAGLTLAGPYRTLLAKPLYSTFTYLVSLRIQLAFLLRCNNVALIFLPRGRRMGERVMHWLNVSLL